jgi:L-rhamnose-H+ transport protein
MTPNPLLGLFFHWLGGLASASFYVPYRSVRGWSWEVFWLGTASSAAVVPLTRNYLLCALGGTAWYLQFFFYTMGESQMGRYAFSSRTLHMSSIIILIGPAVVIGFGNKMVQG